MLLVFIKILVFIAVAFSYFTAYNTLKIIRSDMMDYYDDTKKRQRPGPRPRPRPPYYNNNEPGYPQMPPF